VSYTTARQAIVLRFAPGAVTGIGHVYRSHPKTIPATAFASKGSPSGAVLVPSFPSDAETRVAMGGATSGRKRIDYTVDLEVFFRSSKRSAEDAMDDFEATLDALKTFIRSDRTLASTNVWQFGEGPSGIQTRRGQPGLAGNITTIWAAVRCVLTEFIVS
jgi:hypothetical protein